MRIFIVEDNELELEHLKVLLKRFSGYEMLGSATDMQSGMALIRRERPDLIFLDVQVGDVNSLKLIGNLDYQPSIVCTTLYEQHALQAYEVGAVDYLTKPLTHAKLVRAFQRYNIRTKRESGSDAMIAIECDKTTRLIMIDQILVIHGERDYTSVWLTEESLLCAKRMQSWIDLLPQDRFVQLDRSTIVNHSQIERFTRASRKSKGSIKFFCGREVSIGLTASQRLRRYF